MLDALLEETHSGTPMPVAEADPFAQSIRLAA
jgi:hypothetical protein